MSGKGAARRRGSCAKMYAEGWARIWGAKAPGSRRKPERGEGGNMCGIDTGQAKEHSGGKQWHE
jgi:hypothetical protein